MISHFAFLLVIFRGHCDSERVKSVALGELGKWVVLNISHSLTPLKSDYTRFCVILKICISSQFSK